MKEGHRSPVRTPASASPVRQSRPAREEESPVRGKPPAPRGKSPTHHRSPSPSKEREGYEDDFEQGTNENVSSLEEDRNKEGLCNGLFVLCVCILVY